MSEEPHGQLTVLVRRFVPIKEDHSCSECHVLPHDGTKGHYADWATIVEDKDNIFTNAGKDWIFAQSYATSGIGANGANYIAVTDDAGAPAVGDTTLTGEIAANGLSRAQGAYAHTNGTNTATVIKTFTATGTQSSRKAGLFTASSAGTMANETTYGPVTVNNGDQLQITWTITD